jgi:hypothetical protein
VFERHSRDGVCCAELILIEAKGRMGEQVKEKP